MSTTPFPDIGKHLDTIGIPVEADVSRCLEPGCDEPEGISSQIKTHMQEKHEFCKKCRRFFIGTDDSPAWNQHVLHKLASPKHICCYYCAKEYKTAGAMKEHVRQSHPVDQRVECVGCLSRFPTAAELILHLEGGSCPVISAAQFKGHLQQKYIIRSTLEDGPGRLHLSTYAGADHDEDAAGGVQLGGPRRTADGPRKANLLEDDAASDMTIPGPTLEPEVQMNPKQPRLGEVWPALPNTKTKTPSVISPNYTLPTSTNPSTSGGVRLGSQTLSRDALSTFKASTCERTSSAWGAGSRKGPASSNGDAARSEASIPPMSHPSMWRDNEIAAVNIPFPGAPKTSLTEAEWSAKRRAALDDATTISKGSVNVMSRRVWDPTSEHFDKELFWDPIVEAYGCPFGGCLTKFLAANDLITHIQLTHSVNQVRCAKCLKLFKSVTALMRHCENSSKCRIAQSDRYAEFVDTFTGGFITADEEIREDIPTQLIEKATYIDEDGELYTDSERITHRTHFYTTTKPPDWESVEEAGRLNAIRDHEQGPTAPSPNEHVKPAFASNTMRFTGGALGHNSNPFTQAANNVVNVTTYHSLGNDGVKILQPAHQQYTIRDPTAERKRQAWSHLARSTPSQYNDLVSQMGSVTLGSTVGGSARGASTVGDGESTAGRTGGGVDLLGDVDESVRGWGLAAERVAGTSVGVSESEWEEKSGRG